MPKSLHDSITQPIYTKAVIQASMKSSEGTKRVWCVVEANEDVEVYGKFFITHVVSVLPSTNEDGKKSYHNVETIVSDLYSEGSNPRVFGIRDRDYTAFSSTYICPANVFMTDGRDLEMMMLRSPSVITDLERRNPKFRDNIVISADVMRFLGYLRIYNDVRQLSCTFRDKLEKVSVVWNNSNHSIHPDYKDRLFSKFQQQTKVSRPDFDTFVKTNCLEDKGIYEVCRGHDVFRLLCAMMIKQEFSQSKKLFQWIKDAYSFNDFKHTLLFNSISDWAATRNLIIFP